MRWGCLGLGLALATGWGCTSSAFQCLDDNACEGLEDGRCESTGYCSQADEGCESGRRYSALAGVFADACVAPAEASTGSLSASGTESVTTSGPASASSSSSAQTTNALGDTTSSTHPDADASGASTDPRDSASSSGTGGPPPSIYDFEDDFERADNPELGNGWVEKTAEAFVLTNGSARRDEASTSFPDNLVYRPGLLVEDVEVHLHFRFLGEEVGGFPQVHARLDEAASATPGLSTSYVLYLPDGQLDLTRVDQGEFNGFGTVAPDVPIVVGEDYRFRLRIGAGSPATLDGYLDRLGEAERWTEIAAVHNSDPTPLPAGTMGFSGASTVFAYEYEHIGWFEP